MALRLRIASMLVYAAGCIAPAHGRVLFRTFCEMLEGLEGELKRGRRWGVYSGAWFLDEESRYHATMQAKFARTAAENYRNTIEGTAP